MNINQLEHIIRAASSITDRYELIIFGSQAILATISNGPKELYFSEEADVCIPDSEKLVDLIDGSIGEGSPFHETFGYYAQGISKSTVILAPGWEDRLIKIQSANTDLKVGLCLSADDLAFSKTCAFREKDKVFVAVLFENGYADPRWVTEQVEQHEAIPREKKEVLLQWLEQFCSGHGSAPCSA